jgi:predicted Ser/Thr protein kinase
VEAWKYLLVATEQAQASLEMVNLFLDALMLASSNELHLTAFKEYPDWQSFKGRFELVTVPYLLRFSDELSIYQHQIPPALRDFHVAPHALEVAARFAVLTRLEPPRTEHYPEEVRPLAEGLVPMEKLELYDSGRVPERLSQKERRELRRITGDIYDEYAGDVEYEGRFGASVREIRTVLMNAAQDPRFDHLSPIAVLDELRALVREKSSYEFLRRESVRGYRDAGAFVDLVEAHYIELLDEEVRTAMGLVAADSHFQLFERYVKHISAWTKKEKLPDPVTGKLVEPDKDLMGQVEKVLLAEGEDKDDFRRSLISQIGAFRLENPDQEVDYQLLFGPYLRRLKDDYYSQRRKMVEHLERALLKVLDGDTKGIEPKDLQQVEVLRKNLSDIGYNDSSVRQAIGFLLRRRSSAPEAAKKEESEN